MDNNEKLIEYLVNRGYIHIKDDVYDISKRIEKYDKNLILLYNTHQARFEIHTSLNFLPYRPTYCVGSKYLDSSLILKLKKADNRTEYGLREKLDDIDLSYEIEEKNKNAKFEDLKQDFIKNVEKKL